MTWCTIRIPLAWLLLILTLGASTKQDQSQGQPQQSSTIDLLTKILSNDDSELQQTVETLIKDNKSLASRKTVEELLQYAIREKNIEKQIKLLYAAKYFAISVDDHKLLGVIFTRISDIYKSVGDNTRAEDALLKSRSLFEDHQDRVGLIRVLNKLGDFYIQTDKYTKAFIESERSLELVQELTNEVSQETKLFFEAKALENLVYAYKSEGEFQKAIDYIQRALNLFKNSCANIGKLYCNTRTADFLTQRGRIFRAMGSNAVAMESYLIALDLVREVGNREAIAEILNAIGVLYQVQYDYLKASHYYRQCIQQARAIGDNYWAAMALSNEGIILVKQGKYGEAVRNFEESLKIFEDQQVTNSIVTVKLHLAGLKTSIGRLEDAHELISFCIQRTEESGDKVRLAEALWHQAVVFHSQHDYSSAIESANKSLSISRRLGLPRGIIMASSALGKSMLAQGKYWEAEKALQMAIANAEKSSLQVVGFEQERYLFREDKVEIYYSMAEVLLAQGRKQEAFLFVERAKASALLDAYSQKQETGGTVMSPEERQLEISLRAEIAKLNSQLIRAQPQSPGDEGPMVQLRQELDRARTAYEDFFAKIRSRDLRRKVRTEGLSEPGSLFLELNNAGSDSAVLEFAVTSQKVYLFLLANSRGDDSNGGGQRLEVLSLPISPHDLEKEISLYARQIAEQRVDFKIRALRLYETLIKPVERYLIGKKRLWIVPDGFLWNLPFQTLVTSDNSYLIEKYSLSYAPSLGFLREAVEEGKSSRRRSGFEPQKVIAFGNPSIEDTAGTDRSSLSPLPQAEKEVYSLVDAYGEANVDIYLREEASEEAVKQNLHKARIIHFATHAVPDNDRPLYSRLILAKGKEPSEHDGILEAWEIAQLDLGAELVILSACESGKGKISNGEGVIGLAWAFMIAGVPTAVVSQWKVDSMSTSVLMAEFHRNIALSNARGGQIPSRADALRNAALKLMQMPQYRHPFYWGSFITLGKD